MQKGEIYLERIKERFKECPELLNGIIFIVGLAILTYTINNFFGVMAPFLIAYFVVRLLRPMMVKIKKLTKNKIPNIVNTIICISFLILCMSGVAWIFMHYIIAGINYLISFFSSSDTINKIIEIASIIWHKLDDTLQFLNISINMSDITEVIKDVAGSVVNTLSNVLIAIAMNLPSFILSCLIGIISAFYMLTDYDRIAAALNRQLSKKVSRFFEILNTEVISSFIKMIFSYILISLICLVELFIGFSILGVKDSLFIAVLVALLDVLPVLGSGAVLAPWAIISGLMGNAKMAIGLLVLWGVITVVRQIVEPRIVGSQVGLYPLITIVSMFVGLKLMGGIGLVVCPLYVIICKKMNEREVIHLYKKEKYDNPEDVLM